MNSAIELLSQHLSQSMARHAIDAQSMVLPLPKFLKLATSAQQLSHQFELGKVAVPAAQLRRIAIAKLHRDDPTLSERDWKFISWGLSDQITAEDCLLNDPIAYQKVHSYVEEQIHAARFSRKMWFGLCFSYFAYSHETPNTNANWLSLQQLLRTGFELLSKQLKREHLWASVVARNLDLFGEKPGQRLGQAILLGDSEQIRLVQEYLPISVNSWFWLRLIKEQLSHLFTIKDSDFRPRIAQMLALADQHPRHANEILAATLTRYAGATFHDESHPVLKELALTLWGSPQIKSSKNRWTAHVEEPVCKMVLRWFAKEDLEHFFKLLQGESGVDQARLDYWLKYVDQMNYTRIVMGPDASIDRSPDFIEFRQKNHARLSRLTDGPRDNNAFIMQIGSYYFVEFSGTGNACYIYHQAQLPFNPDYQALELNTLKQKQAAAERLLHQNGWEYKANAILASIGITKNTEHKKQQPPIAMPAWLQPEEKRPNLISSPIATPHKNHTVAQAKSNPTAEQPPLADHARSLKINAAIDKATFLLKYLPYRIKTEDFREKGGAYWILLKDDSIPSAKELRRLGFGFVPNKGFWIK